MKAYVTLLTSDSYVPGALALGQALKDLQTEYETVILVDVKLVSPQSLEHIESIFDTVIDINDRKILAPMEEVIEKLGRPELSTAMSKLLIWALEDYETLIYLDCDTLPLRSLDALFERYADLGHNQVVAAPDIGWPDIFNSGVMILRPSLPVFEKLVGFSSQKNSSFDGADQGLLNEFFHLQGNDFSWKRLPFIFNVTPSTSYQYNPALARFWDDIHVFHFIGQQKPWFAKSGERNRIEKLWWEKFNSLKLDEKQYIHILSNKKQPPETKTGKGNWNPSTNLPSLDHLSLESNLKVFPWNHSETVEPTRVFHDTGFTDEEQHQKSTPFTLEKRSRYQSSGESLGASYGQFDDSERFDPSKALDEIAKIPLKFLSKH